jgi:formylglycine-generating enzyme required for sulfatase activity
MASQFRSDILGLTIVAGGVDNVLNRRDRRLFAGNDIMVRIFLFLSLLLTTGAVAAPAFIAKPDMSRGSIAGRNAFPAAMTQSQRNDATPVAADGAVPEPGETFRDCADCPEMVVVPPGDFDMGSKETAFEQPVHHVSIAKPYAIQRREINFDEWDACADAGVCKNRPSDHNWGRGKQPVIEVSWEDAKQFVAWLSQKTGRKYRLPSEAEWEYAARAGTTTSFWWGKDIGKVNANCDGCGEASLHKTMPTGSYRPNGFGLYDTSGNVYEWVEDCWNDNYKLAPKDGTAWTTGQCRQRVLRGGSFANKANAATSAARFRYDIDVRYYANGFRVARDLQ